MSRTRGQHLWTKTLAKLSFIWWARDCSRDGGTSSARRAGPGAPTGSSPAPRSSCPRTSEPLRGGQRARCPVSCAKCQKKIRGQVTRQAQCQEIAGHIACHMRSQITGNVTCDMQSCLKRSDHMSPAKSHRNMSCVPCKLRGLVTSLM